MFNYEHSTGKPKYEYPHLDDFVVGKSYAFTINPSPIPSKSFTETYTYNMSMITKLLNPLCSYDLRPEISTKSTLLHFHGYLNISTSQKLVAFYFHTIPLLKDYCTFVIKPVEDWYWAYYIRKTKHHMKPYLNGIVKLPYRLIHKHSQAKENSEDNKQFFKLFLPS